jgi:hypothetical protein
MTKLSLSCTILGSISLWMSSSSPLSTVSRTKNRGKGITPTYSLLEAVANSKNSIKRSSSNSTPDWDSPKSKTESIKSIWPPIYSHAKFPPFMLPGSEALSSPNLTCSEICGSRRANSLVSCPKEWKMTISRTKRNRSAKGSSQNSGEWPTSKKKCPFSGDCLLV